MHFDIPAVDTTRILTVLSFVGEHWDTPRDARYTMVANTCWSERRRVHAPFRS